ncbi:Feruloyl CoA ortho-hydroxylase 2 [Citrus sinensis]|nr:Feruloyl CoA ortho-hydroxylase 2 [Citrus sinensis]
MRPRSFPRHPLLSMICQNAMMLKSQNPSAMLLRTGDTSRSFGLSAYEKKRYSKEPSPSNNVRTNLNFCPICLNPELTIGVGRHSDVSTLTVLLQDSIGGFYVRGNDGESWIDVHPIDGSLLINIGDALQILSNGRYKSVEHCVVASGSKNSISVPIFINPRPQDTICPLPEVLASGEKPIYKPVLYSDYVKHVFRKAHDGKKTVGFAKMSKFLTVVANCFD